MIDSKKMETLRINTAIKPDRHLKIDITSQLKEGGVEVILIIESKKNIRNSMIFLI